MRVSKPDDVDNTNTYHTRNYPSVRVGSLVRRRNCRGRAGIGIVTRVCACEWDRAAAIFWSDGVKLDYADWQGAVNWVSYRVLVL